MNIIEFLEARIAEDETEAAAALLSIFGRPLGERRDYSDYVLSCDRDTTPAQDQFIASWWPKRVLVECAAKRAIIRQHGSWPVLVSQEREPIMGYGTFESDSVTLRMSREIAWLTEREYVKRFGVEPPTAPMIRTLAAVYSDHPDYQLEWAA